jgi:hypothetical protein
MDPTLGIVSGHRIGIVGGAMVWSLRVARDPCVGRLPTTLGGVLILQVPARYTLPSPDPMFEYQWIGYGWSHRVSTAVGP